MLEFAINTKRRKAAFLATLGHESGGLRYTVEIWGPTPAQERYEGRLDLGNTKPGDGSLFRGRAFIQVTGRANYAAVGQALGVDLIAYPKLLEMEPLAARASAWFWHTHNINQYADIGDFDGVSDAVNRGRKTPAYGDANGYSDRFARWENAIAVLGA